MSSAFFPLDAVLTPDVMNERLNRYAKELHAVEVWRKPAEDARYRILAKANIGTSEFPTDAGAEALRNLMLPDAPCVNLLRKVGCDVFGKTAMTELAGFLTTQNSHLGYSHMGGFPKNPHGDFAPRGSSSGSAVAVAAGLCDAALGTETRGSLMLPGIANGVVSYKPTRGLISRTRIVPISHHFDAPGVIARKGRNPRIEQFILIQPRLKAFLHSSSQRSVGAVQIVGTTARQQPRRNIADIVCFGRFIQRHENAQALCSVSGLFEICRFSQNRQRSYGSLNCIGIRRYLWVFKKHMKAVTAIHVIRYGRTDLLVLISGLKNTSRNCLSFFLGQFAHDGVDVFHQRFGIRLTTLFYARQKFLPAFSVLLNQRRFIAVNFGER